LSNKNRTKGHNLERLVAGVFRNIGHPFAKTSRAESRVLDNCKVDIANIPFNIQCKAGYLNNRPKYEKLHEEIKEQLSLNYPKDNPLHYRPIVLIHKLDGRNPANFQWTMRFDAAISLLTKIATATKKQEDTFKLLKSLNLPKHQKQRFYEIWAE